MSCVDLIRVFNLCKDSTEHYKEILESLCGAFNIAHSKPTEVLKFPPTRKIRSRSLLSGPITNYWKTLLSSLLHKIQWRRKRSLLVFKSDSKLDPASAKELKMIKFMSWFSQRHTCLLRIFMISFTLDSSKTLRVRMNNTVGC